MKEKIYLIITRYLSRRFSSVTEEKVQKWIVRDENKDLKEQASLDYWEELETSVDQNTYAALERVNERIGYVPRKSVRLPLFRKIVRVASVLVPLLVLAGVYLYYSSGRINMIEVVTAYGEQKHLFLPDSSEVWLNAGTTIRYPEKFAETGRNIYLEGEAYFSVVPNQLQPFIVDTELLWVKVLGTKFNVKAYRGDEKITAALTSGKVEVTAGEENACILSPNEKLTYNRITAEVAVAEMPANETDAWMNGQLIFSDASLDEILQTLERRFNIKIENNTRISAASLYTIKFLKNESPEEILDILQEVIGLNYQKEGSKIIIRK